MKTLALLVLATTLSSLSGCYYDRPYHDRDEGDYRRDGDDRRYDAERQHDRERLREREHDRDDRRQIEPMPY